MPPGDQGTASRESRPSGGAARTTDLGAEAGVPSAARVERAATAVFAVAAVVAAATIMVQNREQWFFHDDFVFAFQRDLADPVNLLRPHFGHNTVLPAAMFQLIYRVVGLNSFWPYQLLVVASHLGVTVVLRAVMLRCRVQPVLATSAAILFLFFGSGREDFTWAFQTTLNGSIVFGFAALLVADRDAPPDRRDLGAGLLLCGSVLCSNLGPLMAAVVAVAVVLRRGPGPLGRVIGPPAALFVVWWVTAPAGTEAPESAAPREAFTWGAELVAYGFRSLTHVPPVTVLLVVAVLVAVTGLARTITRTGRRPEDAVPMALIAGMVALAASLGYTRGGSFYPPFTPRYAYLIAVFSLPVVAWALARLAAGRPPLVLAASGLLLLGLPANVARIDPSNEYDELFLGDRELFSAMAEVATEQQVTRGYTVFPFTTSDALLDAHERGEVPSLTVSDEVRDEALLQVALGPARGTAGACETVDASSPFVVERGDRLEVGATELRLSLASAPDHPDNTRLVPGAEGIRSFDVLVDRIDLVVRPEVPGAEVRVCRTVPA